MNRRLLAVGALLCIAAAAAMVVAGCGKSQGADPRAVADAFVAALAAGDWAKAADMMAWDDIARAQNPDWDTFPASQRSLIVGKLKEQMQATLQQVAGRVGQVKVSGVSVNGDVAQATAGALVLTLKRTDQGWKVLRMQFSGS